MAYTRVSLPRVSGSPTPKDDNLIIIRKDDLAVDGYPLRDAGNVKMIGNFALKAGAKAFGFYVTPSTIIRGDKSEGDEGYEAWIQSLTCDRPGDELAFNEFLANNLGEPLIIITTECSDSTGTRVHGTPCNPMKFVAEQTDSKEKKGAAMTFTSVQRSKFKMGHYTGTIPVTYDPAVDESASGSSESGA